MIGRQTGAGRDTSNALLGYRESYLSSDRSNIPVYIGEALQFGDEISGPAIITRTDTTILLQQGDCCSVDEYGNFQIELTP